MSVNKPVPVSGMKRKRDSGKTKSHETKSKNRRTSSNDDNDPQAEVLRLESQILESRKHYNNIATLIHLSRDQNADHETVVLASVALCRIFTRFLSTGDMVKSKGMASSEALIVSWLKERYRECTKILLDEFLCSEHPAKQSVALTLLMRLVKEESKSQKDFSFKNSAIPSLVEALLLRPTEDASRDEFAEKYFNKFDDIRYQTFKSIK